MHMKFRTILKILPRQFMTSWQRYVEIMLYLIQTVRRLVNLFREGSTSVQDAPRSGAPKLSTNKDKLSKKVLTAFWLRTWLTMLGYQQEMCTRI